MANRYTRALKQIKDETIDEKLELLSEIPTNHTAGLYVNTPGYADPEIEVPGDIDSPLDLEEDGQGQEGYTGNDTTGLFMADGTIKAVEPPGDTSYILGPMSSMWYAWANYTQIGYIRESDRKMVNLGRITGQLDDWDGVSGFTGYGQMTIEQAAWFKNITRINDYRAFYPGPPSSTPDEYGRYICSITGKSKPTTKTVPENPFKRYTPGTNRAGNTSDNFAAQVARGEVPIPEIPRGTAEYDLASEMAMIGLSFAAVKLLMGAIAAGGTWVKAEIGKTLELWKAIGPSATKSATKIKINRTGPTKAKYQSTPKSKFKVEPQPSPNRPPSYSKGRGMGDRWEGPLSNSFDIRGTLLAESIEELPVELIHVVNTIIAEIGNKPEALDKLIKLLKKGTSVKESKEVLTENRKRILRNIKKPVKVKEIPTKFKVKPTGRKNKIVGADMMKVPETQHSFKPEPRIWDKGDRQKNIRASQEKKNEVLELVGAAEHHWTYLTEERRRKRQERVNEEHAVIYDKEMEDLYEKHKTKENKTNKVRGLLNDSNLVYDKLDPQSAESMPATGNPTVDTNVKKSTNNSQKSRKLKILLGKGSYPISNNSIRGKKSFSGLKDKLGESMTTNSQGDVITPYKALFLQKILTELKKIDTIDEGMTSSGMFVTSTLEATGDNIQTDIPSDSFRYNDSDAVTSTGGVVKFGEVAPHNYDSQYWWRQSVGTNYIATTDEMGTQKVTHVSFNIDVGTGIDAPLPQHPLKVNYSMKFTYQGQDYNAGTGTLGTISSSGLHNFELPEFHEYFDISFEFEVDGTWMEPYEEAYQRRQFVGTSIYGMTVTDDDTIDSLAPGRMLRRILDHPGPYNDDASSSMHVFLGHTRTNGLSVYQSMNTMPSGETGGHTGSDRQYLYNLIRSQYAHLKNRYAKTYTINSMGLTRKTPITVFVALDTPESASFVRDGDFDRLSPAEKKKKLEEQLRSSGEYLNKMFGKGMPKGATEIADYEPQQSFMDIQVGDQKITKSNNRTVTDTTRGIEGGKTNGRLTPSQVAKIATNVAGGTSLNPSLRAIGSQGKGLGGEIKIGQHGTGQKAAQGIKKSGFRSGSRQNVYGTKSVFLDPSKSGKASDEFARAGAAAEKSGKTTAGRTASQRAADLRAAGKSTGEKIPVAYKPGTGSRMNVPGTKYAEVGVSADKATKGARLAQNAVTKYPNSAKAAQLVKTGATTAKVGAAKGLAKTLGKAVPFAGAAISAADAAVRSSRGDQVGALLSGLSGVPGPVGWIALGAQIATDAAGITGGTYTKDPTYKTSTSGRGAGRSSFAKEEKEYGSYQDYVDRAKETIDKKKIKLDKDMLDVLKSELGLSDKLSDEDKEYLVDLFDDPKNIDPDEAMKFIKKIQKKLTNEKSIEEQVLTEKKSFKDLTKKIPGYYDGKPSPLGFPVEEPPKMNNGFHPDLVNGKKVANRFNRLDPISARAMPKTGNPHIDKKVKKASKKSK